MRHLALRRERRSLVGLDGRGEGKANLKTVPRLGCQSRTVLSRSVSRHATNTPMSSSRRNPWQSLVHFSRTIVHQNRTFPSRDSDSGSAAPMSRRDCATQPGAARNELPRVNPASRSYSTRLLSKSAARTRSPRPESRSPAAASPTRRARRRRSCDPRSAPTRPLSLRRFRKPAGSSSRRTDHRPP